MGVIGELTFAELADVRFALDDTDPVVGMPDIGSWVKELNKRRLNDELRGNKKTMEKQ